MDRIKELSKIPLNRGGATISTPEKLNEVIAVINELVRRVNRMEEEKSGA
jgi:hypothetical protein